MILELLKEAEANSEIYKDLYTHIIAVLEILPKKGIEVKEDPLLKYLNMFVFDNEDKDISLERSQK